MFFFSKNDTNRKLINFLLERVSKMSDQVSQLQTDILNQKNLLGQVSVAITNVGNDVTALLAKIANPPTGSIPPNTPDLTQELADIESSNAILQGFATSLQGLDTSANPPVITPTPAGVTNSTTPPTTT